MQSVTEAEKEASEQTPSDRVTGCERLAPGPKAGASGSWEPQTPAMASPTTPRWLSVKQDATVLAPGRRCSLVQPWGIRAGLGGLPTAISCCFWPAGARLHLPRLVVVGGGGKSSAAVSKTKLPGPLQNTAASLFFSSREHCRQASCPLWAGRVRPRRPVRQAQCDLLNVFGPE